MRWQIIANGYDQTYPRPSTHATIAGRGCNDGCGVTTELDESSSSELVRSQNVAVRTFSLNKCSNKSAGVSCLNPWGWTAQKPTNQNSLLRRKSAWHPLQHASLVAIENAAARDRKLFPGSGSSGCQPVIVDSLLCTSDKSLSKRQKIEVSEVSFPNFTVCLKFFFAYRTALLSFIVNLLTESRVFEPFSLDLDVANIDKVCFSGTQRR